MQFFAHVGITLGSAWVLQKAAGRIKRGISEQKLNYSAAGSLGGYTVEVGSNSGSVASWLDYRFLLLGSLLPDVIDKSLGIIFLGNGRAFCHTLFFTVLILAAGIYFFLVRKWSGIFCIALGCVTHILLDSMWLHQSTFFWPLFGWSFPQINVSIGPWIERTFHNMLTNPSYYIPEAIGIISLVLLYFNLARKVEISRLIKSRLSFLYQSLFGGLKRRYSSTKMMLSKGVKVDLAHSSDLVEKAAD